MKKPHKQILILAGEASGDLHAAQLITHTKQVAPDIDFTGMGGSAMQKAGATILVNMQELAIVGLQDILSHLPKILKTLRYWQKFITTQRPDLVILVDYAGFNLRIAKIAKRAGLKVLYYICPKVWAWQPSRIKLLQKYVDLVAVIFPFEVSYLQQFNIPAVFVGNPSVTEVKPSLSIANSKKKFALPTTTIIGLFPGSRKSEIHYLLPLMLESAALLKKRFPQVSFVLPLASSLTEQDLQPYLKTTIPLTITKEDPYNTIQLCDAIIAASGTVTLEIALLRVPMVIIYKASLLNYLVAKLFLKIPYIGLCNILLQKFIVRELLQYQATPLAISDEVTKILSDHNYRNKMQQNLSAVYHNLTATKAQALTDMILKLTHDSFSTIL